MAQDVFDADSRGSLHKVYTDDGPGEVLEAGYTDVDVERGPVNDETVQAAAVQEDAQDDDTDLDFDPADLTVEEVKDEVRDNPEIADEVLEAEEAGEGRTTLTGWLNNR